MTEQTQPDLTADETPFPAKKYTALNMENGLREFDYKLTMYEQKRKHENWLLWFSIFWISALTVLFIYFIVSLSCFIEKTPSVKIDWHFFLIDITIIAPVTAILWILIKQVYSGSKKQEQNGLLWIDVIKDIATAIKGVFK